MAESLRTQPSRVAAWPAERATGLTTLQAARAVERGATAAPRDDS